MYGPFLNEIPENPNLVKMIAQGVSPEVREIYEPRG